MPELPEVETIRCALERRILGLSITRVELFSPAMRCPLAPLTNPELLHSPVLRCTRRGRYLVIEFTNRSALILHFGMSGVVRVESPEVPKRKHEHIFFHLSDGQLMRFECPRRFSSVVLSKIPEGREFPPELESLGVEPLSPAFSGEFLYRASRNRALPVKALLMNNDIVTGVGNIYATEALFTASVSPLRPAGKLTKIECNNLVQAIVKVLTAAIEAGGSTIHDFRNVDGTEGKFSLQLEVYGKAGLPCPRCGTTILAKKIGGRTSAYCPKCQK